LSYSERLATALTARKLLFQILIFRGDAFPPPTDVDDDGRSQELPSPPL